MIHSIIREHDNIDVCTLKPLNIKVPKDGVFFWRKFKIDRVPNELSGKPVS